MSCNAQMTPEELNETSDNVLFQRIRAAIDAYISGSASDAAQLADYLTYKLLHRVHNHVQTLMNFRSIALTSKHVALAVSVMVLMGAKYKKLERWQIEKIYVEGTSRVRRGFTSRVSRPGLSSMRHAIDAKTLSTFAETVVRMIDTNSGLAIARRSGPGGWRPRNPGSRRATGNSSTTPAPP